MTWWFPALALAGGRLPHHPGLPPVTPPAAIVGGEPAPDDAAPEVAALFIADLFGCSGVLVAPDLVVSAGHCWSATTLEKSVILGANDYTKDGERIVAVEDWRMPDYLETFDIALFALERDAETPPVRMMRSCEADEVLYDGMTATIFGFGALDADARVSTTRLHRASITIDDADCSDPDRGCRSAVAPDGELRAGGDGVDSCVGDSGGPLFVDTPDGRLLAGIASRASQPASTYCGSGGIYVRADAIADWIENTSGRTLPAAPCDPEPPDETAHTAHTADTGRAPVLPDRCGCAGPAPPSPWLGLVVGLIAGVRGRGRRKRPVARHRPTA